MLRGQLRRACKLLAFSGGPRLASHASAPGLGLGAVRDAHALGTGIVGLVFEVHGLEAGSWALLALLMWPAQGQPCAAGRMLVAFAPAQS